MENEPRAYTKEEVCRKLISHFMAISKYWAELPHKTDRQKCDGLVFSILAAIDGSCVDLPSFDMIPCSCLGDKEFYIKNGENWYEKEVVNDCQLHELLCEMERENKK